MHKDTGTIALLDYGFLLQQKPMIIDIQQVDLSRPLFNFVE